MTNEALRALPSVDRLAASVASHNGESPRHLVVDACRAALDEARARILAGEPAPDFEALAGEAAGRLAALVRPSLRRVINASGVLLQTNLGRAPLSEAALDAMREVSRGYSNLEFDLGEGARGSRHEHVRSLLAKATGADDGIALNNNAAALLMVLQVFAGGREVIVSRGQAVEIGGGFRIPDVLRQSGATLVEVGTTNRTYARDYEAALGADTAAILRVHTSNFQVVGFTHEPLTAELAEVAHGAGALLIDDLGSGCLLDTREFGMVHEPTVQESIAAGSDLALFSGDKLLGGPQAGIIVGRGELIAQLRRHPLARALRLDKTAIAALNATLLSYVRGSAQDEIPLWRMAGTSPDTIRRRARRWARAWGKGAEVHQAQTMVGGGSLPGQGVPTWCAVIAGDRVERIHDRLRTGEPAIVGRIEDGVLWLDPRTVSPGDDRYVERALRSCSGNIRFVND